MFLQKIMLVVKYVKVYWNVLVVIIEFGGKGVGEIFIIRVVQGILRNKYFIVDSWCCYQ